MSRFQKFVEGAATFFLFFLIFGYQTYSLNKKPALCAVLYNLILLDFKGGPEPSNFEDLCLVNVSVKYFSKLCFGTIKIQPELKFLKPILKDFTF